VAALTEGNPNLDIWLAEEPTDPKHTKGFKKGGGFSGTALNATYVIKRLTALFGPVGEGWGYRVVSAREVTGAPIWPEGDPGNVIGHEIVQVTEIEFWWRRPIQGQPLHSAPVCSFSQVGQTMLVEYSRKYKTFSTDEEAWKKSLTDAITKAASHIGIGADIHMGLFDDNKYVAARREEVEDEATSEALAQAVRAAASVIEGLASAEDEAGFRKHEATARGLVDALKADPAELKKLTDAVKAAMKRLGLAAPKPKAQQPAEPADA
jgi:hypothetical protein